jgi:AcrR family transcriptional regulator
LQVLLSAKTPGAASSIELKKDWDYQMNKKTSARPLGKQPREVAERTKKRILSAALNVFAKEGFPDAKLRVIATKAGTSHNLIRHHFGSKDDLWKAVIDHGLKRREIGLKKVIDSGRHLDPVKLYKKTIASHILFAAGHPELTKILLHSNSRTSPHLDYIIEKQQAVHRLVEPIFKKVQDAGYFRTFDHNSFSIYMRAIAETPIATSDLTNKLLNHDIRSNKGIALHTQRVIEFLFCMNGEEETKNSK